RAMTHMTGHLLVLEGLARILAAAGRTDRAVRDRNAVRSAQAAEIPALHAARKTLADRGTGNVNELADDKVIREQLGAHRDHAIGRNAEFDKLHLRLDLRRGEVAAHRLRDVLYLASARAELQRDVAVLFRRAVREHLAAFDLEHSHRHVLARVRKDAGHADLLCDHAGAHCSRSLQLDFDVDARGEVELHQRVHRLRSRVNDIEQALMRAHFELLAALLVDVRPAVHRELLYPRRQRDRTAHLRARALRRRHDFLRGRVENAMIERLQADSNILAVHVSSLCPVMASPAIHVPFFASSRGCPALRRSMTRNKPRYSITLATTPAPTVRPPSRIAKRS